MKVLFVASECAPLVKTGGLADVAGALPLALAAEGCAVRVLLPAYPGLAAMLDAPATVLSFDDLFGGPAQVLAGRAAGLDLLLLDAPHLYDRKGTPYLGPDGRDWIDNPRRFAALARAGAEIGRGALGGWLPDILHAHDWQAGLAPLYLSGVPDRPGTVTTIHNIAFQGNFDHAHLAELGLPEAGFTPEGFEFWGRISFLKAGLVHADAITTVSPTYAAELMTPEFGMGLEGVIATRRDRLEGILNGIDETMWNPAADPYVQPYDARRLAQRAANRAALADEFHLDRRAKGPLFGVVSRMTSQKGLDLLVEALPSLLARGGTLVLLGAGETGLENALAEAAAAARGRVGLRIGYDEALAHRIYAGADALVVPSRFEPCGLTQLYALRYGALPVVARTGGLADTVIDANEAAVRAGVATGFHFAPGSAPALAGALDRVALAFAGRRLWRQMQRNAMGQKVGWQDSARRYRELYARVLAGRA